MVGAADEKKHRAARGSTPGRPKKKANEYFDLGKVGRKTGITLADHGVRDEHGLEPMEHIFSSPVKDVYVDVEGTIASESIMQESSGPDFDLTMTSRKTPRLPPPRASTPKHTNIGSPKRMSTSQRLVHRQSLARGEPDSDHVGSRTQPPPNRRLDFGGNSPVRHSIEKSPSPFKPRHALRRSLLQKDVFGSPSKSVAHDTDEPEEPVGQADNDHDAPPVMDEAPLMVGDDDYYNGGDSVEASIEIETEDAVTEAEMHANHSSPSRSRTTRQRRSNVQGDGSEILRSPPGSGHSSGRKRTRASLDNDRSQGEQSLLDGQLHDSGHAQKKQRGKQGKKPDVIIHHLDGIDETIDPALLAYGDEYEANSALEAALELDEQPEPMPEKKGKGKGKTAKGKGKERQPREKERSVRINESPSKLRNARSTSRQSSLGPTNNYHLRATTPFEDAGERVSRFGRNLIQPLKFWANEARIYRRGEIEGIVRAEEVEVPKRKVKRNRRKRVGKLEDLDEDGSDTESVMADEWEEDVGVIAGMVANWSVNDQVGVPEDLIREDLAFASSSIVVRDVPNSQFRYAKILTLPFFGSGVVEIPPNGFKRAKNSRKMQQCFFVHEGKVMVEIGAPGAAGGSGTETTQFAISKGGVWVVPRGNDYAITNESRTKTARIFFAQGCEVEALAER